VLLDYLDLFKKFEMSNRPSYSLEAISNEILPHLPKLDYEGTLHTLYNEEFNHFLRYNIRDTECLKGFEQELGYVALANEMVHNSTGRFRDVLGTIKLAEMSIINYCHYEMGVIVPDCPEVDDTGDGEQAEGAYVLEPKAGLQEWIGSVDINSLYPSAIRSINISPETLMGQFTTEVHAFEMIRKRSDTQLTLVFELTGEAVTKPAHEWREYLIEQGWAISGYGTVYDQSKPGVIPQILTNWFATRKKYQSMKKDATTQLEQLKAKYKAA
jgi:DNA polymerase elongation subunit (family B)